MLIRYYGSCGLTSGYAHAANELALALLSAGAHLEIRILGEESEAKFEGENLPLAACVRKDADLTPMPDVAIFHTLPHSAHTMLTHLEQMSPALVAKKRVVYTTWEACSMISDDVCTWLRPFDQIWVPSRANHRAMQPYFADEGLFRIPHSFGEDSLEDRRRERIGGRADTGRFRFYTIGSWSGRKNQVGLLRAWAMAFGPEDNVRLHVHAPDAASDQFMMAGYSTGLTPAEMAPIKFTNETLSDADIRRMHRTGDCFVTASRAEAWHLPAFDAVLSGRQVISTAGLGSDDFLAGTTARMVAGYAQPSQDDIFIRANPGMPGVGKLEVRGSQGVTSRQTWNDPCLPQLAEQMQGAYHRRESNLTVHYDLCERFGRKAVGELAMAALSKG